MTLNTRPILYLLLIIFLCHCGAQQPGKKKVKNPNKLPSIATKIKNFDEHKGLFSVWTQDNKVLWSLSHSQLDDQYLWLCNLTKGLGSKVLSGAMGPLRVIRLRRNGKVLLVEQIPTQFKADPERAESRGLETNYAPAVLARLPIIAQDLNDNDLQTKILVDASNLIFGFPFSVSQNLEQNGYARSKDKNSIRITKTATYPENLEWDFELDLQSGKTPDHLKKAVLPEARRLSLSLHFSFSRLAESDYRPRKFDFRAGYFITSRRDISRPEDINPTEIYINRWNLKKKHPEKKLSEVVKPITFWITNNTPYEYREIIRDAVLEWNKAFEKIGFLNAVECHIQSDDADWTVGDFRYSVIQWLTSNTTIFAGHGPARVNPLTGEILRAHIRIEGESFHGMDQLAAFVDSSQTTPSHDNQHCNSCDIYQSGNDLLTLSDLSADWSKPINKKELITQWLRKVVMHEVGHTLGLRHNFKGSLNTPLDKVHDKSWTEKNGLTSTVMEYTRANIHPDPEKQGYYYSPTLGPYDYWIIKYGYIPLDPDQEEKELNEILQGAPLYGTDEDSDQDPYTERFDATADPLGYAEMHKQVIDKAFDQLKPQSPFGVGDGSRLRRTFSYLIRNWYYGSRYSDRFIAGQIYPRRPVADGKPLMEWVDPETENRALAMMLEPLHDSSHLKKWQSKLDDLPPDRKWSFWYKHEDSTFSFENTIISYHRNIVSRLLSPATFNRLLEHRFRENKENQLTQESLLLKMKTRLTNRIIWDHWSRINLDLFVDALMKLAKNKSLNKEGKYLVIDTLDQLRSFLDNDGALGKQTVNEAFRKGLKRNLDDFFQPYPKKVN